MRAAHVHHPAGLAGLDLPFGTQVVAAEAAGQDAVFTRLGAAVDPPSALAGRYRSEDLGAEWQIEPVEAGWAVRVSGPHARTATWTLHGLMADLVEVRGLSAGMPVAQLVQLQRDATARVDALQVHSSRIRGLRFVRQ
jgi:hypothetical protein